VSWWPHFKPNLGVVHFAFSKPCSTRFQAKNVHSSEQVGDNSEHHVKASSSQCMWLQRHDCQDATRALTQLTLFDTKIEPFVHGIKSDLRSFPEGVTDDSEHGKVLDITSTRSAKWPAIWSTYMLQSKLCTCGAMHRLYHVFCGINSLGVKFPDVQLQFIFWVSELPKMSAVKKKLKIHSLKLAGTSYWSKKRKLKNRRLWRCIDPVISRKVETSCRSHEFLGH
jgi:hypothetical protein